MKITKYVSVDTEVEITISTEDIIDALAEETDCKLAVMNGLNGVAQFLNAVPDAIVAELTMIQRKVIADFFEKQRNRFVNPDTPIGPSGIQPTSQSCQPGAVPESEPGPRTEQGSSIG